MELQDMKRIAQELGDSTKQQLKLARIQCVFSVTAAVCCAALLIVVLSVVPRLMSLIETTETLAVRANTVLTDLEAATSELSQADLAQMVDNVTSLVDQSSEGVSAAKDAVAKAVEKIDAIDIDTLNQAIRDFSDVVEPLARFFNIFD